MSDVPPPEQAPTTMQRPLREQKWVVVMAACLAGMMIGYGLSGFAPRIPDWKRDAAQHHAMYRGDTLADLNPDLLDQKRQLAMVAEVLAVPLPFVATPATATLRFRRAQTLAYAEAPLGHIVFSTRKGNAMSLFVRARADVAQASKTSHDILTGRRVGSVFASWMGERAEFLLIGGQDLEQVEAIADKLATHLLALGKS